MIFPRRFSRGQVDRKTTKQAGFLSAKFCGLGEEGQMSSRVDVSNTVQSLKKIILQYGIIVVLFIMIIIISILRPQFLEIKNLLNVLNQSCIYGIMALGATFVIITKGIDLSAGYVVAISGLVVASLAQSAEAPSKFYPDLPPMPLIAVVAAGLAVGGLCGSVNGLIISKTKIPPFITTLGMLTILRGICLFFSNGKTISGFTDSVNMIGSKIGAVPVPVIIFAFVILLCWTLLNHTRFGADTYAIGGNEEAAEVSGVRIERTLVKVYVLSGLLCGIAAIVYAGRVHSLQPNTAAGYELTAIAAAVIGGTSLNGGVGTIGGTVIGAIILASMRNGMTLMSMDAYWQEIVEGVIIIAAVIIDRRKNLKKK
jgi:inositol transport system permease protein